IGEIYMVSAVGGPLRYSRYDGARFVAAAWPPDLAGLSRAVEREVRTPPPSPEVALWPRLPAMDAAAPAIVIPIWIGPKPVYGYVVARIDMAYVTTALLPQLGARFFGSDDRDFEVAIASRDGTRPIFASHPDVAFADAPDAEVDVLGIWWANLDQPFYAPGT